MPKGHSGVGNDRPLCPFALLVHVELEYVAITVRRTAVESGVTYGPQG